MEKKTIGGFISALRKANGMTQKELAEKLNVSDKTVSRWECDDSVPDLSIIPVIAEIFDITCDELLRGERKSPSERDVQNSASDMELSPKGEKQRQRILSAGISKYKAHTFISIGIAFVGIIAAMICNLGFLRGYIGFFISILFYLCSIIYQAININNAFSSISDDSMTTAEICSYKHTVIRLAEIPISLSVILFAISLPLITVLDETYAGLSSYIWFEGGAVYGIIALIVVLIICTIINISLIMMEPEEKDIHNRKLKLIKKCGLFFVSVLIVTIIIHMIFKGIYLPENHMSSITFDDYDSFVEYMEQDIPGQDNTSETEALTETITDAYGNVLCSYVAKNHNIWCIDYSAKNGSVLPIKVSTYDDYNAAKAQYNMLNSIFIIIYILEAASTYVIYVCKRKKILQA
jgi:transcriptional regulator with XRE-family HTH domain